MNLFDRLVPELNTEMEPPVLDGDSTETPLPWCIASALFFVLALSLIICGKLT